MGSGADGGQDPQAPPAGAEPPAATEPADSPESLQSENEKLRANLAAAEARFHATVERSLDGVIVLDGDGFVQFANRSALALFGRSREELIGSEFGYPLVAEETTEIDLLSADGGPIVCEMRTTSTVWADDEDALLVLIRDVTARRDAEARERQLLREHAAREEAEAAAHRAAILDRAGRVLSSTLDLDQLLRGLADSLVEDIGDVCLIDIDDNFGPMRRLVGARRDFERRPVLKGLEDRPVMLTMETSEGRVFRAGESELIPEATAEWLDASLDPDDPVQAVRALAPCSLMLIPLKAGTLPWGVVTIVGCDGRPPFQTVDLLLAEELVRRAAIAVENARLFRLALTSSRAKSDFLAVVSHELRTPLAAMIGYAGLLAEGIGGELNDQQSEFVENIRQSSEHLVRLIDQIITFARLEGDHETADLEDVEPAAVLRDVATLVRPMADKRKLELQVDVEEDERTLRTDERKLSQILLNLATNAIKYTDEGSVRLSLETRPHAAVFRVHDTGRGIPEDQHEEIFEPFRQLENPETRTRGGAGIGLSVVKNLTRLLGGEIGVESEPDGGSVFTVRLPWEHVGGLQRSGGRTPAEDEASADEG